MKTILGNAIEFFGPKENIDVDSSYVDHFYLFYCWIGNRFALEVRLLFISVYLDVEGF